jgi:hypothetical protein
MLLAPCAYRLGTHACTARSLKRDSPMGLLSNRVPGTVAFLRRSALGPYGGRCDSRRGFGVLTRVEQSGTD